MFPLSVFKRVKMKGKDIPYKMFTFFTILYPSSIFNNYKNYPFIAFILAQ